MRIESDKEQRSNSLCDTCKIGDTCYASDKGIIFANTRKCFRYEWIEKEHEE